MGLRYVFILVLAFGMLGCASRKPVRMPVSGRVVDPKCVGPTKCDRGDWLLGDDGKLVCTGTMRAVLACVPAK